MGAQQTLPLELSTLREKLPTTFLTRADILALFKVFHRYSSATQIADGEVPCTNEPLPTERTLGYDAIWKGDPTGRGTKLLQPEQFLSMPCLRACPFAPRLYTCFRDNPLGMSFEAFVHLASAMSDRAPPEVKHIVAFRIFDFNDDGLMTEEDVLAMMQVLTGVRDLWAEAAVAREREEKPPADAGQVVNWIGEFPARKGDTAGLKDAVEGGLARAPDDPLPPQAEAADAGDLELSPAEHKVAQVTARITDKVFKSMDSDNLGVVYEADFAHLLKKVVDFRDKFSLRFI